jgi:two-component system, response regulator YesN
MPFKGDDIMHGVLIVDDEKFVRLWIKNCINWNDYGFEIKGEANNGCDALNKILELKPRLVISDMDMPEMDGLELIEKANENHPEVIFLIVSGYNEFNYMRSAIKNNAVDYLLKPLKVDDITMAVAKIKSRVELEDKKRKEELRAKTVMKENLELRKEKFFGSLLDEQSLDLLEFIDVMEEVGISSDSYFLNVLSLDFDGDKGNDESILSMSLDHCFNTISKASQHIFSESGISSFFLRRKNEIIGIIIYRNYHEELLSEIVDLCKKVLNNINNSLEMSISIGVGNIVKDIMCLRASYMEAKRSLDLRMLYGKNSVLTFLNTPEKINRSVLSSSDEYNFVNSIMTLNFNNCKNTIINIFCNLERSSNINLETIKMVYYRLISAILKQIYDAGITPSYLGIEEMEMFNVIRGKNSIEQIRDKLLNLSKRALDGIANNYKIKNLAIEKAKAFISENFDKDIALTEISSCVHLTPNYLCNLFKAEVGYNVFDYITNLRIEKAKSLMKDESLKTYVIGEMVGYKDSKYFCRVFKKCTGQPPAHYRKQLLKVAPL